jgi:hypothetical protein
MFFPSIQNQKPVVSEIEPSKIGNRKFKIILGDFGHHSTILGLSSSKNWWPQ